MRTGDGADAAGVLSVPLPVDEHAPSQARRAVREMLDGEAGCVAAAVLVTSELVTNAVLDRERDGREVLELRVTWGDAVLRIELADSGRRQRLPSLSMRARGGQGMRILAALSERWGFVADGCTMWSEVACTRVVERTTT